MRELVGEEVIEVYMQIIRRGTLCSVGKRRSLP